MAFDLFYTVILVLAIILIFARGVVIVQPYQQALEIRLGQEQGPIKSGIPVGDSLHHRYHQS